jgi:phosphomannomutase/phosphoglucomutase
MLNQIVEEIFRAYDVRGVAGTQITSQTAYLIGRAFAKVLHDHGANKVCIGRDARLSSEKLETALIEGFLESGIDVISLGVIASPVLYFATCQLGCAQGVMVTASHNPAQYNGFKFVLNGKPLTAEQIKNLYVKICENDFIAQPPGALTVVGIIDPYIDYIAQQIKLLKPLTIVVDSGNGVAGHIAPKLYRRLGCTVHELYCDLDGSFPNHHPDPSRPENLKDLQQAVINLNADVGLAFDGDADRLGVVSNKGEIIWPDRQMMLFSQAVLQEAPGSTILFDVKCSKNLAEVITAAGGKPVMGKTGHSFMKLQLKEINAALAGEMSGHIFFNQRWFGFDDGIYCGARLLEILANNQKSSSELFAQLPNALATPEINVAIEEHEKFAFIEQLIDRAQALEAKKITLDGLRLEFCDGWALMRASNTSPIIVLRFEADNQLAFTRMQQQIKELMLTVKPDLVIPW